MRIALVHDWLTGMRGGEKCLEVLCRLWPDADLYTLIHRRGSLSPTIERMHIRTSFLQRVPGILENYRYFLPLMPAAIESFRLHDYDVVVSLSHCVAKSVRVPPHVPHVCYCFTPMRYAWQMRQAYWAEGEGRRVGMGGGRRAESGEPEPASGISPLLRSRVSSSDVRSFWPSALRSPLSAIRHILLADLRRWDRATSNRVTHFVAISRTVRERIRHCYGRDCAVIHPPVDVEFYRPAAIEREDFYLCVSALAPYKRIDLAIRACNAHNRQLVVIGTGPEEAGLRALAGPTVTFLGWQSDEVIRDHLRRCLALLFPGEEDFGIVPLEAQACGAPVIAFAGGGATETVIPAIGHQPGTGLFFPMQSVQALGAAINRFEAGSAEFSQELAVANARSYHETRFIRQLLGLVGEVTGAMDLSASTDSAAKAAA